MEDPTIDVAGGTGFEEALDGGTSEHRAGRPHTIHPAPPVQSWVEKIAMLERAGELGVVFWRMLRKVQMWAHTPPDERQATFQLQDREAFERLGYACAHAPGLVEAFGTFASLIRAPQRVDGSSLAEACHLVSQWAAERPLMETALLFAEAAAIADPENPARANDAGLICRRAARDDRAHDWYLRAFGLAVRAESRNESLRALLGYGNLMKDLGRHADAKVYFQRAAQRAHNYGRRRQAGEAHHDLLTIAAELGAYQDGERHVRQALDLYSPQHPQLPGLAHDWAFLLIRLQYYTPAIRLLELALPKLVRPEVQTVVWGNLARAYGGARRQQQFNEAARRLLSFVGLHEEFAPSALNGLAQGSWSFGEWEAAEKYALAALEVARARKEGGEERVAQSLIEKIRKREPAPYERDPPDRNRLGQIVRRFEDRLARWKAPGHREPEAGKSPTIGIEESVT